MFAKFEARGIRSYFVFSRNNWLRHNREFREVRSLYTVAFNADASFALRAKHRSDLLSVHPSASLTVACVPPVVREGLQGGTRIGLLSVFFFHKYNIFTAIVFTHRVLLINSWISVHFPCWFSKITTVISHSHFVHGPFCQFWFSKLLVEWYLTDWVFLEESGSSGATNGTRSEKL